MPIIDLTVEEPSSSQLKAKKLYAVKILMSRKTYALSQKPLLTLKLPVFLIRNIMFCELQFRNCGEDSS